MSDDQSVIFLLVSGRLTKYYLYAETPKLLFCSSTREVRNLRGIFRADGRRPMRVPAVGPLSALRLVRAAAAPPPARARARCAGALAPARGEPSCVRSYVSMNSEFVQIFIDFQ